MNSFGFKEEEFDEIKEVLKRHSLVDKVVLFGSRAKNTFKPMSDVDLVVFGDKLNYKEVAAIESSFEDSNLPFLFDIVNFSSITSPELLQHIEHYGKIIYLKGWAETTLGEITSYINRGITPKYSEEKGIYVLNQRCIRDNKVTFDNARLHDIDRKNVPDDKIIQNYDVLICSTGVGTLGRVAQIKTIVSKTTVDSHVTIVRGNNKINASFLGLLLRGKEREIEHLAEGSTGQTELPRKKLESLNCLIPEGIEEQKSIAAILTAFDDKIELLQAQNKTLEETAQTIFKEWFGKYQVGDELPEGWRMGKLEEMGTIITGKTPSKSNPKYWGIDYDFVTPTDFKDFGMFSNQCSRSLSNKGWNGLKKNQLPAKSILVTCIGSDMGKVVISSKKSISNQQINSIVLFDELYLGFIYEFLKSQYDYLRSIALGGSTMPIINKTDFSNIEIPIPIESLVMKYHNIWQVFGDRIFSNQSQIQTLTQTRDALLPKLMSGELRINEFKD